jgi:hypothetical protein
MGAMCVSSLSQLQYIPSFDDLARLPPAEQTLIRNERSLGFSKACVKKVWEEFAPI